MKMNLTGGVHMSASGGREAAAGAEALPRWLTAWHAKSAKMTKIKSVIVYDGKYVGTVQK